MQKTIVDKPKKRSNLRLKLGKEYFILKRKLDWWRNRHAYSVIDKNNNTCCYSHKKHQSVLLRQLKDVDMYLQYNKITNLRLAIEQLDGSIIKPNQRFSIWQKVGRPSKKRGFLEGLSLHNGQVGKDIGGGLCQLGNLIYWMVLHSDLTIIERWRHSFDVFPDVNRTIPFACGATLAYNYIDLQLLNKTNTTYRLNLWLDDEYLHGELLANTPLSYRYEIFETDHVIEQQWWGGYTRHNKIWQRKTHLLNNQIEEKLISENHAIMMYTPYLTQPNEV
ncbi:VanW family protein [Gilliamella apis]|uniref:VanW family protein n=1 Tax=Gilliamella apis TaxID=1970738 RepID=UPI000D789E73|nr:VanW family protein [Gilliamella apis]PXY94094.1 vancomycin resistance protein [Gilliamella apis]WLS96432.1 VanW family protein [Gilliamella apis]